MRITLFLLSLVAAIGGAASLLNANSPTDEISALIMFGVGVILLSASAVVEAVARSLRATDQVKELLLGISAELENVRKRERTETRAAPALEPTYIVRMGNDSNGPFPVHQIKELRRRGAIDDDTPVALEGGNVWRKTREVIGV